MTSPIFFKSLSFCVTAWRLCQLKLLEEESAPCLQKTSECLSSDISSLTQTADVKAKPSSFSLEPRMSPGRCVEIKSWNVKANPASKNITEFVYLATEAIIDEFTEREVLHLGLIVRKLIMKAWNVYAFTPVAQVAPPGWHHPSPEGLLCLSSQCGETPQELNNSTNV